MIPRRWVPRGHDEEVHYFKDLEHLNMWLANKAKGRAPKEIGFVLRPAYHQGPPVIQYAMRITKLD